jgi:hypothetical protein
MDHNFYTRWLTCFSTNPNGWLTSFNSSERRFIDVKMPSNKCYTVTTLKFIKHIDLLFKSHYFSNPSAAESLHLSTEALFGGKTIQQFILRKKESYSDAVTGVLRYPT